jgi:hypothetical protein
MMKEAGMGEKTGHSRGIGELEKLGIINLIGFRCADLAVRGLGLMALWQSTMPSYVCLLNGQSNPWRVAFVYPMP